MEIKQLKLNGENIYPKVAIDSIVGEDGSSKVDTVVTENSDNLITSGAVYDAILAGGGGTQVQADWNQTDSSATDYIKNKPTIPSEIVVDSHLDANSTNPVQNKVVNGSVASLTQALGGKQETLRSGTNIKTINNQSILGSGNIEIQEGGTTTVDDHLDANSTNPVQNKVINGVIGGLSQNISSKVSSVKVGSTTYNPTSGVVSLPAYATTSTVSDLDTRVNLVEGQVFGADHSSRIDGLADSVGALVQADIELEESLDTAVNGVAINTVNNTKKLQYTTIGGASATDIATIDTTATENSTNLITSGAVNSAIDTTIGRSFRSVGKYFKGVGLQYVYSNFNIQGQVIDPSVNTRIGAIELTVEWFNAKGDTGESDRLVKKSYRVGKEQIVFEGNQWRPEGIISDINNYPGNGTDFVASSQPFFTYTSSGGRIDIDIHLGLRSSKYQMHSITITKVYDPNDVELPISQEFLSTTDYNYEYGTDAPLEGIYVIEGEVILRTGSLWYKIGNAESSPIKPLS